MPPYALRRVANRLCAGKLLQLRETWRPLLTDLVDGTAVTYRPLSDIGRQLYFRGAFEAAEFAVAARHIRRDGVVLDVGANIGLHTLRFAQLASEGLVLAFEPGRQAFRLLVENVSRLPNVVALPVAVAEASSVRTFHEAEDNAYSGLKDTHRKPIEATRQVLCVSVDDVMPWLGALRIDLVKIDVEGTEQSVLQGMVRTLGAHRPAVFCEIYRGVGSNEAPEETVSFLIDRGYDAYVLSDGEVVPFTVHDDEYYNYLFLPRR